MMDNVHENTVLSERQVNEHTIKKPCIPKLRILIIGNSMTLRKEKKKTNWADSWGMAASCREKDYVHQLLRMVCEVEPAMCMIMNAESWERAYWKDPKEFEVFDSSVIAYNADIIVVRLGENICPKALNKHSLIKAFGRLFDFLDPMHDKKWIVTDEFVPHAGKDVCIEEACRRRGVPVTRISHLGLRDDMKDMGSFKHRGGTVYPGDKGMQCIAEIIFDAMKDMLKKE